MKAPKILPWLARRATVSDPRAAMLWDEACRQAASLTGERDTSCYWGAAQQNLLYLLEMERWRSSPPVVWPWLLLHDGLESWSRLVRRRLAPISVALAAWQATAGGGERPGRTSPMPLLARLSFAAGRPGAAIERR